MGLCGNLKVSICGNFKYPKRASAEGFQLFSCLDIPFSYAKIWGETKFQLHEYPQIGEKATDL